MSPSVRRAAAWACFAFVLSACAADPNLAARGARPAMPGPNDKVRPIVLWHQAEAAGDPASYLVFLKAAPANDPNAAKARGACRKLLVEDRGGEKDALDFLRLFPEDPAADGVRRALERVRFAALKGAMDPQAADLFLSAYPGTPEAQSLAADASRREFKRMEALGTRLAYRTFLKRWPDSSEAAAARARLAAFDAPPAPTGDASDLALLPRLRGASPSLVRLECRAALTSRLRREKDVFGAAAESLRERLFRLSKARAAPSDSCGGADAPPAGPEKAFVAGAVRALALLRQRQQAFAAVFSKPEKLASEAQDIGARAAALADESEAQDLELEALYGGMPADPKRPDDTATKNAREALRRAKRVFELSRARGAGARRASAGEVLSAMDRQADLLLEIIAERERPAAESAGREDAE